MGNALLCCGKPNVPKKKTKLLQVKELMRNQEIYLLQLIYKDLSSRIKEQKINLQNFILYFQKNGLWGQQLFKQFDSDQSKLISLVEFIYGIAKIMKTSEQQKINLLFYFFAELNEETKQGINFKQFLTMLYNYPKQQLKCILNDESFFLQQLKPNLVPLNNRRFQSILDPTHSTEMQCMYVDKDNTQMNGLVHMLGSKNREDEVSKFNIGTHTISVKTNNINYLVKKYAKSVFKKFNIDIQKGMFSQQQFYQWIKNHKQLYNTYYNGFHNKVWEIDPVTLKPKLFTSTYQKKSLAKTYIDGQLKLVYLVLFHTLIVVTQKQSQKQIMIICLDGLIVKKDFYQQKGYGFEISHRDGIYQTKYFYFINETLQKEWMEFLGHYRDNCAQQRYDIGERIGAGKYSIVYKAVQKQTTKKYAIKIIQIYKFDDHTKQVLAHQSSIMSMLRSPFCCAYKQTLQTKTHIYIITQLIEGKDLFEYVKQSDGGLDQFEASIYAYQILMGVKYMHDLGIIHRDLKPQNVMISLKNDKKINMIKIIDFGFSNYLSSVKNFSHDKILVGTPSYIAPQIIKKQSIDFKIDNFAIGGIIYFMLSGTVPFNGFSVTQILQRTLEGAFEYRTKKWKSISQDAKNLIDGLLENRQKDRTSIQQALKHPWILNAIKNIKQCANTQIPIQRRNSSVVKKKKTALLF